MLCERDTLWNARIRRRTAPPEEFLRLDDPRAEHETWRGTAERQISDWKGTALIGANLRSGCCEAGVINRAEAAK